MPDEADIANDYLELLMPQNFGNTSATPAAYPRRPDGKCANDCDDEALPDGAFCSRECADDAEKRRKASKRAGAGQFI